jgi:hypothetical protein
MSRFTRTAKRAAAQGRASMAVPFFKLIAVVLVVGWPLAIVHHGHSSSVLGWIIGAVWWVGLAIVVVAYRLGKPRRAGTRRR